MTEPNGIVEQDRWAFHRMAQMLSRIRMDDQGYGVIRIVLQDKAITSIEQQSTFRRMAT